MADIILPYKSMITEALLSITGLVALVAWFLANMLLTKSINSILPVDKSVEKHCRIGVVIPVRNAGEMIGELLDTIAGSKSIEKIIVVDDASSDDTPWIVLSRALVDSRIRYIRVEKIPDGWMPKPYLLYRGVGELSDTRIDVILFLDSDVLVVDSDRLASTLCSYTRGQVIMGLMPLFHCSNTYCRIAETVLNTIALSFYGFHRVHDPQDKLAWFYGCCWAVNPQTYSMVPHLLVKASIVEDRALAETAKAMGIPVRIHDGRELVEVKGYTHSYQTRGLIARLAIERYRDKRVLAVVDVLLAVVVLLAPYTWPFILVLSYPLPASIYAVAWLLETMAYTRIAKMHGYSVFNVLFAPIAIIDVIIGLVKAARGRIEWSGRYYYLEDGMLFFDEQV